MPAAYRPIKALASGGMADVWLGMQLSDTGFSRLCAIKTIKANEHDNDDEFVSMFRDEAKICQSLQHANVVQVLDFTKIEGGFALIMEFVQGVNLLHVVKKFRERQIKVPTPVTLYIVQEVAKGLHYVHTRTDPVSEENLGIVHRDITPSNILLSSEGEVKITDFGIAKASVNSHATQAGIVKGKYQYMSPEQFNGKDVDFRTDVYALGCILWECLAGRQIHIAQSEVELIQKIASGNPPPPLVDINPEVDATLAMIAEKAMHVDPDKRYQSAGQFAVDIQQYMTGRKISFTALDLANFLREHFDSHLSEIKTLVKDTLALASTNSASPLTQAKHPEAHDPDATIAFNTSTFAADPAISHQKDALFNQNLTIPGIQTTRQPVTIEPSQLGWTEWQREKFTNQSMRRLRHRRRMGIGTKMLVGLVVTLALLMAAGYTAQTHFGVDLRLTAKQLGAKLKEIPEVLRTN
jgi:serine/threonine protein kinase